MGHVCLLWLLRGEGLTEGLSSVLPLTVTLSHCVTLGKLPEDS